MVAQAVNAKPPRSRSSMVVGLVGVIGKPVFKLGEQTETNKPQNVKARYKNARQPHQTKVARKLFWKTKKPRTKENNQNTETKRNIRRKTNKTERKSTIRKTQRRQTSGIRQ